MSDSPISRGFGGRDRRDAFETLRRGVGAHRLGVPGDLGEVGADLRFGYDQAVRGLLGKPVVGNARQLAFDRRCGEIRFCQRPECNMQACEQGDDCDEGGERHDMVAACRRADPVCIFGSVVARFHPGAMRSRQLTNCLRSSFLRRLRLSDRVLPSILNFQTRSKNEELHRFSYRAEVQVPCRQTPTFVLQRRFLRMWRR